MKAPLRRCTWCGKDRRKFSEWEQRTVTTKEWKPLCSRCANRRRLDNPWNALPNMRRIGAAIVGPSTYEGGE